MVNLPRVFIVGKSVLVTDRIKEPRTPEFGVGPRPYDYVQGVQLVLLCASIHFFFLPQARSSFSPFFHPSLLLLLLILSFHPQRCYFSIRAALSADFLPQLRYTPPCPGGHY